jgi:hypothetical protein
LDGRLPALGTASDLASTTRRGGFRREVTFTFKLLTLPEAAEEDEET